MDTKHSQEPWEAIIRKSVLDAIEGEDRSPAFVVTSPDGDVCYTARHYVAPHPNSDADEARTRANWNRIAACVNGCANLNPAAYQECINALAELVRVIDIIGFGWYCRWPGGHKEALSTAHIALDTAQKGF